MPNGCVRPWQAMTSVSRDAVEACQRHRCEDDGRRNVRRLRRPAGCDQRRAAPATGPCRDGRVRDCGARRALRVASWHGRTAGRRSLRNRGQPGCANYGIGSRGPGAAVGIRRRRWSAIGCRRQLTLRELGRVRLRGLSIPEPVYQLVHPSLRVDFPALRALDETPHNLPRQATSFLGRGAEQAEIMRLLAKYPLVTLTGSGGVGKTRIAIEVGHRASFRIPRWRLVRRFRATRRGPAGRGDDCRRVGPAVERNCASHRSAGDLPRGQEVSRSSSTIANISSPRVRSSPMQSFAAVPTWC